MIQFILGESFRGATHDAHAAINARGFNKHAVVLVEKLTGETVAHPLFVGIQNAPAPHRRKDYPPVGIKNS